ncbi:hypothetical protein HZS_6628 [Henneguya salminicola]|nr:hypothetical protein HZS_6628 [Henneguya salminicola]
MEQKEKLLKEFQSLINNEGWTLKHREDLFVLYIKDTGTRVKMLKSVIDIQDIHITDVYNFITNSSVRKKWDHYCINNRTIARIDEIGDISYYEGKHTLELNF